MKLLLDMSLPPAWVDILEAEGWVAVHWHDVGDVHASDVEIMGQSEWMLYRDP